MVFKIQINGAKKRKGGWSDREGWDGVAARYACLPIRNDTGNDSGLRGGVVGCGLLTYEITTGIWEEGANYKKMVCLVGGGENAVFPLVVPLGNLMMGGKEKNV